MTKWYRLLNASLLAASGVVLGLVLGLYGPIMLAVIRGDDPIHRGHYATWIEILSIAGPIMIGATFGALGWNNRLTRVRYAVHFLALLAIGWQVVLMLK
jgi:hypothetical protein